MQEFINWLKSSKWFPKKKGIDFITIDLTWNSPYVNTTVSATYKINSLKWKIKLHQSIAQVLSFTIRVIS